MQIYLLGFDVLQQSFYSDIQFFRRDICAGLNFGSDLSDFLGPDIRQSGDFTHHACDWRDLDPVNGKPVGNGVAWFDSFKISAGYWSHSACSLYWTNVDHYKIPSFRCIRAVIPLITCPQDVV